MTTSHETQQLVEVLRDTKSRLQRVTARLSEPLAVIGLGCRFPECDGPDAYWDLLVHGRQIELATGSRWSDRLTADHEKQPGRITANRGGFLKQVDEFDTAFFGISGREAAMLDPQQRLLLEVAWETFEHAAIDPTRYRGRKVGAFVGICSNDYLHRLTERPYDTIDTYLSTGNSHGAAAGRLSYFMDWRGPAVAIDTACSSSLTALHLAARSLRYGDCEMALVMGVNVILAPELSISLSQAGMLSPTGRCHTFSEDADGFARGEGCGGILLKRLSQAEHDGDRILCVVRGTASNQDGRSNGLTAPNGKSQEDVIQAALIDAKVTPNEVDYIEAHGTGTPLGDPIEIAAMQSVFGQLRQSVDPQQNAPLDDLYVGSAKANLGHLEGAAGIAGVIKVALSLHQQTIPPHPNVGGLSSKIDWSWPIQVPGQPIPWRKTNRPRVAGVSSFGFGGSNAHAVLAQYLPGEPSVVTENDGKKVDCYLLVLSAKSSIALAEQARRWAKFIRESSPTLADVCYTAAVGRTAFEKRAALLLTSNSDIAAELDKLAEQVMADSQGSHPAWIDKVADQGSDSESDLLHLQHLRSLAKRYLAGQEVDWSDPSANDWGPAAKKLALPVYPFQRTRRWFDPSCGRSLLGQRLDIAGDVVIYESDLGAFEYLRDHSLAGTSIFPATGYLELAVAAGYDLCGQLRSVRNLTLLRPIALGGVEPVRLQTHLSADSNGYSGRICIKVGHVWQHAATFQLAEAATVQTSGEKQPNDDSIHLAQFEDKSAFESKHVAQHYEMATALGFDYGPSFRCIDELYAKSGEVAGQAFGTVSSRLETGGRALFAPSTLDACLQVAAAGLKKLDCAWLPASIQQYVLHRQVDDSDHLHVYAAVSQDQEEEKESLQVDVLIQDAIGQPVACVRGLILKRSDIRILSKMHQRDMQEHTEKKLLESPPETSSLQDFLHRKVAEVMGLTVQEIPLDKPLDSLGLDSLMAFELHEELQNKYNTSLPMELFLQDITLEDFCRMVEAEIACVADESWVEGEI